MFTKRVSKRISRRRVASRSEVLVGRSWSDLGIRLFDVGLSVAAIAATPGLFLVVTGLVSACIGFPPFHVSNRVGKGGREYRHVKFKSMLPGTQTGRVFFEQDRINRCGRWLRRLHLDELPELFLILKGDMCFVGPRPLPRFLLAGLDTSARESVPPGWTGPAQIHLLRNGSLNKQLQIDLDNRYVESRSLACNLRLLLETGLGLLARRPLDMEERSSPDRAVFLNRLRRSRPSET